MPKVTLNDISLYYEVYGKGKPLLLIGGLGSDSASWLGVVKEFSSCFKTVIFDNRNSGRSDIVNTPCTIRAMAEDVIKLMDFLKIEKTHIIGHSMGGYIAQELAIRYPRRIDKLVLESTAVVSSKRNNILFEDFLKQLRRGSDIESWIRRWTFWLFSPKTFLKKGFVDMFVTYAVKYPYRQHITGFSNQINAIASFDARKRIKAIKTKTLILQGQDDILITPPEAELLAKNIPKSIFRLLDGVAHSIHIEHPELFIKIALRFLNSKK